MKVEAVIFDLDGTIIEYKIDVASGKRDLRKVIAKTGLNIDPTKVPIFELLEKAKKMLGDGFEGFKKEVYRVLDKYEVEAAKEANFVRGAQETLRWLRKKEIKLALVTNNCLNAIKILNERLGIEEFFDLLLTRDDIEEIKPSPKGIKLAMKAMDVKNAIMVGDSPVDILASKRAGIISVGIPAVERLKERLILSGPDFLIGEIQLIKDVIELLDRE